MNKLIISMLTLTGSLLFSCNNEETKEERPNVVLFLIDDYGYGDISFEGNTQIKTPHIDRIASEGVRFERFYQSSGACAPTRASLLTGRYYLQTGVWGVHYGRDFIRRDEVTIANVLQENGYITGAFGKWHSGKTLPYFSWNRGFDVGVHPSLYQYFDSRAIFNNKLVNFAGPVTDVVGDQVVKFIENNQDKPFFAYVPFQAIHEPFNCPPEIFRKYKAQGYSDHVARLYGMVEVLDNNVGKILTSLDQLNLAENTVVMFLSDDGPSPGCDLSYSNRRMNDEEKLERSRAWGYELKGGKATIWEGGSRTPFYLRWPAKVEAGKNYHHLSGVIDVFPTLLEMCGVDDFQSKLPLAGKSFWPVLQLGDSTGWEDRKYFDNSNFYRIPRSEIDLDYPNVTNMSVHYKNYKLIRRDRTHYDGDGTVEFLLYNLKEDPQEQDNVITENPEIAAAMKKDLLGWYQGILDEGRAFAQPVYEVGNWQDRVTAINLDGALSMTGGVRKSDRSEFRFSGWEAPGAAMNFIIDVLETGDYQVELGYDCDAADIGSEFMVFTEHDTATAFIHNPNHSISGTLHLPAGQQQLNIQLVGLGNGQQAVTTMNNLQVHRIIQPGNAVLKNPGVSISATGMDQQKMMVSYASSEFLLYGGRQDEPVIFPSGEEVALKVLADNPEMIQQVELYQDFDKIATLAQEPFQYKISAPDTGFFTLNAEITDINGVKYVTRILISNKKLVKS